MSLKTHAESRVLSVRKSFSCATTTLPFSSLKQLSFGPPNDPLSHTFAVSPNNRFPAVFHRRVTCRSDPPEAPRLPITSAALDDQQIDTPMRAIGRRGGGRGKCNREGGLRLALRCRADPSEPICLVNPFEACSRRQQGCCLRLGSLAQRVQCPPPRLRRLSLWRTPFPRSNINQNSPSMLLKMTGSLRMMVLRKSLIATFHLAPHPKSKPTL